MTSACLELIRATDNDRSPLSASFGAKLFHLDIKVTFEIICINKLVYYWAGKQSVIT